MLSMLVSQLSSTNHPCGKLTFVDNYHRDMNVFAEDITIEDDMSVLVKYGNGATMTYHLTAYSVSSSASSPF